jgi:filamentous hemagglutinin family protein
MRPVNLGSLLLSSGIALGEMVGIGGPAFAEVTIAPDTLPVDSQVVTEFLAPETPLYRIQGGTVVGGNLFHSLQTFRLSPQETARFEPGSGIERIITRVLGSDRSVLDGRIQIESITPVDLYLLNPRGIILGKNAVLDFNGAFLGSSSDRLLFEDGSIFEVNNPSVPLLTVSVPVGLQFGTQSTPIAIDRGNLSLENGFISKESGSIFHLIGSNINLKNTYFDIPQGDIYLHSFGDMELDGISDLVSSSLFARNAFRHFRLESQGNLRFINSSLVASQSFQFDSHQNIELSNIFVDTGTPALTIPVEKIADIELLAQGKILANPTATGNALSVIFVTSTRNNIDSGNIILKSGSDIDLSNTLFATTALSSGRAGSITLEANRNLRLDSTFFASDTFANNQAGVMNLKAGEDVILDNVTTLSSTSFGQGNASEIQVEAGGNVLLDNNSSMSSNTSDQGNAGSIRLRSERGNITLQRGGTIAASTFNAGKAGNILMEAGQSLNLDAGYIYSLTAGSGPGGQIDLRANQNIHLKGSSTITTAATFLATGPSGNIQLNAGEAILVEGQFQAFSPSALTVSTPTYLEQEAIGIDTNSPLRGSASPLGRAEPVSDRFFLAAQAADYPTVFEADQFPFVAIQGTVGPTDRKDFYQIEITEPGTTLVFDVDNTDQNLNAYLFVANTKNVVLASSREAIVPDLGSDRDEDPSFSFIFPSVGTYFIGIQPDEDLPDSPPPLTGTVQYTLNISRIPPNATNTRISSQTEASSAAGNLRLNAPLIQLKDGGTLAVNSQGTGPGGNIEVTGQRLELSNNALITAETRSSQGGNLTLNLSQWLQLQNGSQLSATAGTNQTGGNGGNITIDTPLVIALPLETNRITANAFSGNGGNIDIDTQSILGDRFLNISASSQLGIDGVVNIEFSGVGLENLLTLLADDVLDVSGQIAAHCHSSSYAQRQNQFVIVGRNGLPTDPRQALPRETLLSDLRWPGISGHSQTAAISFRDFPQASPPIQEAHTWVQRPDGAVELIGQQNPLSLGLENCR